MKGITVLLFAFPNSYDVDSSYSGSKYKIPNYQNGCTYLTSHRACYVDNDDPRKYSVAVDLKDVDRIEFYVCHPHW